jgi:alpha-glucosidase (family GH31 glycosyl hydrolase)
MYISIPVYLGLHSNGSYLIFYENTFDATFTFSQTATANFEGGALRYYFTCGAPAQLVDRYTELTGRPFLPPRWSLGYQVREEADHYARVYRCFTPMGKYSASPWSFNVICGA